MRSSSPSVRRGAVALCLALWAAPPATAQTAPARPDPLDAAAPVLPATHRSALTRYRSAADPQTGDWKEANRRVNRIGGWRSYAREAQAPASAASAAPSSGAHRH